MLKPRLKLSLPKSSFRSCLPFSSGANNYQVPNMASKVIHFLSSDPRWPDNPELKKLVPGLRPPQVKEIISTHRSTEVALRFFFWISKNHFYKHDVASYVSMLNRLVKDRYLNKADEVRIVMIKACRNEGELRSVIEFLNDIRRKAGFQFSFHTYNALLTQLNKFGMVVLAQSLYNQLLESGMTPSLVTFNLVINVLCKKGLVQEAELVVNKILELDMCPDVFTYTSLILGHCRNRNLDKAFEVFDTMIKQGCDPNSVTYSTLVNGLCKEGRLDDAMDMLEEMNGKRIESSVHTYTVPISSLCEYGRVDDAVRLFRSMKDKGCYPDVHNYTALIGGLFRAGRMEIAIGLYQKMFKDGLVPSVVTYNLLIRELCVEEKYDIAFNFFAWMERHGSLANSQTYNAIIKGLCARDDIEKSMLLFNKMLKDGPPPTTVTYNTLILGNLKQGNHDNALRLLDMMKDTGCEPDAWTYSELISGFCKGGKLETAASLFDEMVKRGIGPGQWTYTALIDGYCKEGKLDVALALLKRMRENGSPPNIETYNAIISGFSKQNQFSEAERLCADMSTEGLVPNVITYTSLIDGLCRNGATDMGFKIFNEMESHDCSPNLQTYTSLIYGLCQEGRADEAERLLEEMERKRIYPDEVTFTALIDGFVMLGRMDNAFLLFLRMVDMGCKPNFRTYSVLLKGLQKETQLCAERVVAQNEAVYLHDSVSRVTNFDLICHLLSRLSEIGSEPTMDMYSTLISGLCKHGRSHEANQLVEYMKVRGMYPTMEMYSSLLVAHCKNLEVTPAFRIFNLAKLEGFKPPLSVYKVLIHALCIINRVEEAEDLLKSLLEEQKCGDLIVWTVLVDGLLKGGKSELCIKFLHLMESRNYSLSLHTYVGLARELSKAVQNCSGGFPASNCFPLSFALWMLALASCELVDHSASMKKRKSCSSSSFGGAVHHEERDFWIPPKKGIVAGGDPDCNGWSDKQNELCYDCQSCQASFVYNIKQQWRRGLSESEIDFLKKDKNLQTKILESGNVPESVLALEKIKRPLYEKHPMAKFAWTVAEDADTAEWYNNCLDALNNVEKLNQGKDTSEIILNKALQLMKGKNKYMKLLLEKELKAGDLAGVQPECLTDTWIGKDRWAFIDLSAGPFAWGPAVGGEGVRTDLSLPNVEKQLVLLQLSVYTVSNFSCVIQKFLKMKLKIACKKQSRKSLLYLVMYKDHQAVDILLAEIDIYELFAFKHCKRRRVKLALCEELDERMRDLKNELQSLEGEENDESHKKKAMEALKRMENWNLFTDTQEDFQNYTVARDTFLAHLGSTLWGSMRHIISPSIADGAFHHYEKISFQLFFITQEKVRTIKQLPVDLKAIMDGLSSLLLPSQKPIFSPNLLSLSEDPALAMAFSVGRRAAAVPLLLVNGTYRKTIRTYLDSSILQYQLQKLNDHGSLKGAHAHTRSTLEVPIFWFIHGEPLLVDKHYQAKALSDMIVVVQSEQSSWESHLQCNGQSLLWDLRRPIKAALAAVSEHLAGLLPLHLVYSHAHETAIEDWIWSAGCNPFSITSQGWDISQFHLDTIARSYIITTLEESLQLVNSAIRSLLMERTSKSTYKLFHSEEKELVNKYNYVVSLWRRIATVTGELRYVDAMRLLLTLEDATKVFSEQVNATDALLHPIHCATERKVHVVFDMTTIPAFLIVAGLLYVVLKPGRAKPKIN
ncbi:unnamed protein product [Linum tenue]|uniref:DUF7906 domain-containing protein n=1 Tax=Linum tenue TaxID=586396 RepID=A0AAV0R4J6_9ROSI|nr:unnamed protein product [Linum tenue]